MPRKGKGKKGGRKGKKGGRKGGRADSLDEDVDTHVGAGGAFGRGADAAVEDAKPGKFDDEEIDEDEVCACGVRAVPPAAAVQLADTPRRLPAG